MRNIRPPRTSWALLGPPGPSWAPVVQKGALLGRVIGAPFGAVWRRLAPFGQGRENGPRIAQMEEKTVIFKFLLIRTKEDTVTVGVLF